LHGLLQGLGISWTRDEAGESDGWILLGGAFPLLDAPTLAQLLSQAGQHGYAWLGPRQGEGFIAAGAGGPAANPGQFSREPRRRLAADPVPCQWLHDGQSYAMISHYLFAHNRQKFLEQGVLMLDHERVWIEDQVQLAEGVVLEPCVYLRGRSRLAALCQIGLGSVLIDCELAEGVQVKPHCHLEGALVGAGATIGPFAHLRPGTRLGQETRVGNFVETKNVSLGDHSKASHLAYLGDAHIGRDCNIGAGVITCNYDGFNKNLSQVGDRVFIGSDCQLVAPIRLGDDCLVGAGSTLTMDVPEGALAIGRSRQLNLPDHAEIVRQKARKKPSE
jgi:bifunctional UDP-N-acetylglucosamine pyrophosphorylase/glucosamine-1-phosphate N-acetyltransferase